MQPKKTITAHVGIGTVLIALWLSVFCNQCLASVSMLYGHDPVDHCRQDQSAASHREPQAPVHGTVVCDGHCNAGLVSVALQSHFSDGVLLKSPSSAFRIPVGLMSGYTTIAAQTVRWVLPYDRPAASYFPPFQRYTVLLN